MKKHRIETGDTVKAVISPDIEVFGIVEHKACATGDCWVILDDKNQINYIQTFQLITLIEKRRAKR